MVSVARMRARPTFPRTATTPIMPMTSAAMPSLKTPKASESAVSPPTTQTQSATATSGATMAAPRNAP